MMVSLMNALHRSPAPPMVGLGARACRLAPFDFGEDVGGFHCHGHGLNGEVRVVRAVPNSHPDRRLAPKQP
jgi:hypothetical protein